MGNALHVTCGSSPAGTLWCSPSSTIRDSRTRRFPGSTPRVSATTCGCSSATASRSSAGTRCCGASPDRCVNETRGHARSRHILEHVDDVVEQPTAAQLQRDQLPSGGVRNQVGHDRDEAPSLFDRERAMSTARSDRVITRPHLPNRWCRGLRMPVPTRGEGTPPCGRSNVVARNAARTENEPAPARRWGVGGPSHGRR